MSREIAARRARGIGGKPALVRCAQVGATLAILVLIAAAASGRYLASAVFDHQNLLLLAMVLGLLGYYFMHLSWGVLAGVGHYVGYSTVTAAEGLIRLAICVGLVLVGTKTAGPYGLAIGVAPFVAAVVGWAVQPPQLDDGPPVPARTATHAVAYLLGSSFLSQFILLIGPVAVKVLAGPGQQAQASKFLAGMTLVRIPLFLFNAFLAVLIPRLAAVAQHGRRSEFVRIVGRLCAAIGGLAVVGSILAGTLGPTVLRILFGASYVLPGRDLAALSVAACTYLLGTVLAFGLISLGDHLWTTLSWAAGVVTFALLVVGLGALSVVARVEAGFIGGCAMAAVTMAVFVIRQARGRDWTPLSPTTHGERPLASAPSAAAR